MSGKVANVEYRCQWRSGLTRRFISKKIAARPPRHEQTTGCRGLIRLQQIVQMCSRLPQTVADTPLASAAYDLAQNFSSDRPPKLTPETGFAHAGGVPARLDRRRRRQWRVINQMSGRCQRPARDALLHSFTVCSLYTCERAKRRPTSHYLPLHHRAAMTSRDDVTTIHIYCTSFDCEVPTAIKIAFFCSHGESWKLASPAPGIWRGFKNFKTGW